MTSSSDIRKSIFLFVSGVALVVIFSSSRYVLFVSSQQQHNFDPYQILNVQQDANLDQIKQAYRNLAKQLHPDRSNLDVKESENKFIEVNKAFQILKDPERRRRYDQNKITEDNRYTRDPNNYHGGIYVPNRGFRTYTFYSSNNGHLRKRSITSAQYYNEYFEASRYNPVFIFFYSDFCLMCNHVEAAWSPIADALEMYNVASVSINVQRETQLALNLGTTHVPHIACLIDKQIVPYLEREISKDKVLRFLKSALPSDLVPNLNQEDKQTFFISSTSFTNRLHGVIINNHSDVKLKFLLLAYSLRDYYKFCHISTRISNYETLFGLFNIDVNSVKDTTQILVFDEDTAKPRFIRSIKNNEMDVSLSKIHFLKWPLLQLPKLSSQKRFDDACLYNMNYFNEGKIQKKLCVILFVPDIPKYNNARHKLREFIKLNNLAFDPKVIFTFIDSLKQSEFVTSLAAATQIEESSILQRILLLKRIDKRKAVYEWLPHSWNPDKPNEIDKAKIELFDIIQDYKTGVQRDEKKVILHTLGDEEGPTLLQRSIKRLKELCSLLLFYINSKESPITILLLLVGLVILAFCFSPLTTKTSTSAANTSFESNDESIHLKSEFNQNSFESEIGLSKRKDLDTVNLIELKAETYNGMVRLLKPGYRSIILLCDLDSKEALVSEFTKVVWPFRRNKTLLFGYLLLEKNLNWFKSLLSQALCYSEDDEETCTFTINKSKCIGTVLSLNGFKKYFRMYHAKHLEGFYPANMVSILQNLKYMMRLVKYSLI